MTGIVIVSHSWKIAEGVRDLALEMAAGYDDKIIAAGGLDDENKTIGTDAVKIMQAVIKANQAADNGGVVILADIGSGIMSAQTAIELLSESDDDSEKNINVKLADAPIVEGAVCAAESARGESKL